MAAVEFIETSLFGQEAHYWRLADVNATTGGVNLTNNGTVTFGSALFGNGADMGASNTTKYLSAVNDLGIAGGACTFLFWLKLQTEIGAGVYNLFAQADLGNFVGFFVDYQYNGGTRRLRVVRERQNVADDELFYNVTLGTADWTQIALTYDATTVRGYVNGVDVGNVASSGNGTGGYTADSFSFGASTLGGAAAANFTSAIYDDFVVFSSALSAGQIFDLYTGALGGNKSYAYFL